MCQIDDRLAVATPDKKGEAETRRRCDFCSNLSFNCQSGDWKSNKLKRLKMIKAIIQSSWWCFEPYISPQTVWLQSAHSITVL